MVNRGALVLLPPYYRPLLRGTTPKQLCPSSILYSRSSILDLLFSIFYSRSSILDLPFSILDPAHPSILYSQSSILYPLSSILQLRCPQDDLGDVEDLDVVLLILRLDAVVEHRHAEGTGRRDRVGAGGEGLLGALDVDALPLGLL